MAKVYLYREASATTEKLDEALSKAQGEYKRVVRNRKGPYGMFADLCAMQDATQAANSKYGLAVNQTTIEKDNGGMTLVTELSHKGEFKIGSIPIPPFDNPQRTLSFVTYMARLGYARILCLSADDAEDGEDLAVAAAEPAGPADIAGVLKAISQATTLSRIDQLWKSVKDMGLPKPAMERVEKAFREQHTKIEQQSKPPKEKGNANNQ